MGYFKKFVNGTAFTAETVNDFIMEQVIARFANATERNNEIPTPEAGQHVWLASTNQTLRYDGAAWVELLPAQLGSLTQRPTVVCTSTTRPAHAAGRLIYEADTKRYWSSDGSAWAHVAGGSPVVGLIPFASPWVHYDDGALYETGRYWKDGTGHVHVKGLIKSTAAVSNAAVIGTLPVGFRPAKRVLQHGIRQGNASVRIDVDTNGQIMFSDEPNMSNPAQGWISLNLCFLAA